MSAFDRRYDALRLERPQPEVLLVVMNRPTARNAFNTAMATELLTVFQALAHEPDGVRAAVLTGEGDRAFCAGADLKERRGMNEAAWRAQHKIFEDMARAILDCPIPVIGAVNGAAFGGGCELALACDFAYAADDARFALTETSIGLIPGIGGTQLLPRRVGTARAKEILLSARPFSAEEAAAWGIVNRLCARETLVPETLATAARIAANAPLAVAQAMRAVDQGMESGLAQGLAVELDCYDKLVGTEDVAEGVAAFNEKRQPVFKGK
ncbi:MAG: enoyl-CoA hydratase-related protein [Marivibrio sp.]|uniref:enoyl-CoA hydratase/isomerase family protein n=1 Tax=Marivibrio sp. TaxID=2039719 RepID=UPI0032EF495C